MKTRLLSIALLLLPLAAWGDIITFADQNVKAICVQNWDTNGDGELSEAEAAVVTDLGTVFKYNTTITSFDELQYFTALTSIGDYAFWGCSGLISLSIPNSVTSIGLNAFYDCLGLQKVIVNDIAAWYNVSFFNDCSNPLFYAHHLYSDTNTEVTNIVIPNSVTHIGDYVFYGCSGLTSVTIPNSVTSIGGYAFHDCSGLTVVNIPNSVSSIGGYAFRGCLGLTSVIIPNSVTSIGQDAFEGCLGLTSVTIPNSVTSIGGYAFQNCSGLNEIIVESGNNKYDSRNNCNAIIETASNTLITGCKNTVIPNSVTSIGVSAFSGCSSLTSITIPNSVTSIGVSAFSGCSSLTSVAIPNSVTSIGNNAFWDCSDLTSVTIPNSVTRIDYGTFYKCSGLTSVTIPNSVTSISDEAFYGCSSLTAVKVVMESPLSVYWLTFYNCDNATLFVPKGSKAAYQAANYWMDFKSIVEFPEADVNQDGEIDVVDVVDIARFVVGTPAENFVEFLADLNSDNEVNLGDAVTLVNDIAGDQNFAKALRAPRKATAGKEELILTQGNEGLTLNLTNQRDYTAFQFDLYVPEGIDVAKMMLNAQRKQKHQLLYNKVEEGHYRVAALSTSNRTFLGNNGELLSFALNSDSNGNIAIRDIRFFDTEGVEYLFNDLLYSGAATGIQSINNSQFIIHNSGIYDLSGRRVSASSVSSLPKGTYIVNGKKVVVK